VTNGHGPFWDHRGTYLLPMQESVAFLHRRKRRTQCLSGFLARVVVVEVVGGLSNPGKVAACECMDHPPERIRFPVRWVSNQVEK